MKHSRTQNRLGMLFFKLRKLAPFGAPVLKKNEVTLFRYTREVARSQRNAPRWRTDMYFL